MNLNFNRRDLISFTNFILGNNLPMSINEKGGKPKVDNSHVSLWLEEEGKQDLFQTVGGTSTGQIDPLILSNGVETIEVLDCILSLITRVGRLELNAESAKLGNKEL